jgi:hypothetical protein
MRVTTSTACNALSASGFDRSQLKLWAVQRCFPDVHRRGHWEVAYRSGFSAFNAYYRFARGADDVADIPSLLPDTKLALLDLFESTLTERSDTILTWIRRSSPQPSRWWWEACLIGMS